MYKLLSVLGHPISNRDLKEIINKEGIEFCELQKLSIEKMYQSIEHTHYDFLVFRDSVMEISLNLASIVQRILKINESIKIVLILDKEYDDFIYRKLDSFEVTILHETNIAEIAQIIFDYKSKYLNIFDEKEEDYDSEEEFIFNLNEITETKVEKKNKSEPKSESGSSISILGTENKIKVEENNKVRKNIFPLQQMDFNQSVYLFLNMHRQETQMAMQFAKNFNKNKSIVYLEFDKRNEGLFKDIRTMNLNTILVESENSLVSVMKLLNEFKQDNNIVIINAFYTRDLLLLKPVLKLFIESMQGKHYVEQLVRDTSFYDIKTQFDILLAYYEKGLPNVDYLTKVYASHYHTIANHRIDEYQSRQKNQLMKEEK